MTHEQALPCPFCGMTPDSTDADFCYPTLTRKDGTSIYRAGCIESAGGCGAEVLGDSPNDAIWRWNTRTPLYAFKKENRCFEVITEDGELLACTEGPAEVAFQEALHYVEVYRKDGPVEMFEVHRIPINLDFLED